MVSTSSNVTVRQRLGGGLGASQIASALGLSPWKPPIALFLELTGQSPPTTSGEPAYWGTRLEPLIRSEYIERHGVEVEIPKESEYHREVTWARATVDGYILRLDENGVRYRSGILEVKTVGLRLADHWDDGAIPPYYVCQAAWSMFVTGLDRVDFAVLIGGQAYHEATLHRDVDLEADLIAGASEFWDRVQRRVPPEVDDSDAYTQHLKARLARRSGMTQATQEIEAIVQSWRDDECELKRIGKLRDLKRNLVLAQMADLGATKVATASNGTITLGEPGSERDWKALAKNYATRLQLAGVAADVDEDVKPYTTAKDSGSLRRSPTWTKET